MKLLITFIIFFCISFLGQGYLPMIVTGISGWIAIVLFLGLIINVICKIFSPHKVQEICTCTLCGRNFKKVKYETLCSDCLENEVHRRYLLKKYNKYIK